MRVLVACEYLAACVMRSGQRVMRRGAATYCQPNLPACTIMASPTHLRNNGDSP